MKKTIAIILTLVFALSALSVTAFADDNATTVGYSSARVEKKDLTDVPNILDYLYVNESVTSFKITGPSGLKYMGYLGTLNENFKGLTIYLANDIDMTGQEHTQVLNFQGIFDGQGHVIDNLKSDVSTESGKVPSIFYQVSGATIKNLIIGSNCEFKAADACTEFVGSIARNINNSSVISNIYVLATVEGGKNVGGIVGCAGGSATIVDCTFAGSVKAKHLDGCAGGFTGFVDGPLNILNCRNTGNITTTGYNANASLAGGFIGRTWENGLSIQGSINNGKITSNVSAGAFAGGIVVSGKTATIKNCTNYGVLIGSSGTGLIGNNLSQATTTSEGNQDLAGTTDTTLQLETVTPDFPESDPYVPGTYDEEESDDKEENTDDSGDDTTVNNETTEKESDTTDTAAPESKAEETETEAEGGCGSTVGGAIAVLTCAGFAVAIGKKKRA